MTTATRSESQTTKIVSRPYLLQWQVRNVLSRTTAITQETLTKIDMVLANRWISKVSIYGLDGVGRSHVGLQLRIDWATHMVHLLLVGDKVAINRKVYSPDDLAPEVYNAISLFNQAVNAECLRTEWRVIYVQGVHRERSNRELGFVTAAPLQWAGTVVQQSFPVPELPELTVTLLQVVPDETERPGVV